MCREGQVAEVLQLAHSLRDGIAAFWLTHGIDKEFGGFYGTLDRSGKATSRANKGIVQQARHCWSFSRAIATKSLTGEQAKRAEAAAKSAWAFMNKHLKTPDGLWYWVVSRNGTLVDDSINLYGQWFGIYAAVQYSQAFKDPQALKTALATFRAVDARFHDGVAGGWNETASLPSLHEERLPGGGVPRTLNIFLHSTEALASLYEASGDDAVLQRLVENLQLIMSRLVTKDDLIYEFYDPATWAPVGPPAVNYGHSLESAWLVSASASMLQREGRLPAAVAESYVSKAMAVAALALQNGYDPKHGGVFEAGVPGLEPGAGNGSSTYKVWWIQSESMVAMAELYKREGDCRYLDMLQGTLKFVDAHIRDRLEGEWVWQTEAAGKVAGWWGYQKGNMWKASYHNMRSLMLVDQWLTSA